MRDIFNKKSYFKPYYIFIIIIFIFTIILNFYSDFYYYKQNFFNNIYYKIYENIYYINNSIYNIKNLIKNNSILLIEKNDLEIKLNIEKYKNLLLNEYKNENIKLKKILEIKNLYKDFILSKIIYKDYLNSIFIINKGYIDNVKLGQPVLNEYGILGQIIYVEKKFSHVILTTNRNHYIPVKIKKNNFILRGYGYNNELYFYNNIDIINNDIKIGDILISSGIDEKFPKNYPVGIIEDLNIINNRINKINIKSIFNNKYFNYVFIIN